MFTDSLPCGAAHNLINHAQLEQLVSFDIVAVKTVRVRTTPGLKRLVRVSQEGRPWRPARMR